MDVPAVHPVAPAASNWPVEPTSPGQTVPVEPSPVPEPVAAVPAVLPVEPVAKTGPPVSPQRLAVMIAALVGLLAAFLPWLNIPIIGGLNGVSLPRGLGVFGWLAFLFFALTVGLSFIGNRQAAMRGGLRIGVIIPGILGGLVGLFFLMAYHSGMSQMGREYGEVGREVASALVQLGFGVYLVILSGAAVPVLAFVLAGGKPPIRPM